MYKESAELVLVLSSDLYSLLESILVDVSRLSSCPILHHLLTTAYFKRTVYDFGLRRLFYSKQDFKNPCYSSA